MAEAEIKKIVIKTGRNKSLNFFMIGILEFEGQFANKN